MKFYDYAAAPSPRRTRLFLAEKGLSPEIISVDLGNNEQLEEAFRKINPRCTVPVLELDDGRVLTENTAIASYLEALVPTPPLMGQDAYERALVLEWNARVEGEGLLAIAETLRNSAKGFRNRALTGPENYDQIPELAERGRARILNFFQILNERLSLQDYLAADAYTFADMTAFVFVEFAAWVKVSPGDDHQNLLQWHDRIKTRPAVQSLNS